MFEILLSGHDSRLRRRLRNEFEGGALLRCHHRTDLFPDEHPVKGLFRPDQYRGGLGPLHAAGTVHPL